MSSVTVYLMVYYNMICDSSWCQAADGSNPRVLFESLAWGAVQFCLLHVCHTAQGKVPLSLHLSTQALSVWKCNKYLKCDQGTAASQRFPEGRTPISYSQCNPFSGQTPRVPTGPSVQPTLAHIHTKSLSLSIRPFNQQHRGRALWNIL